MIDVLLSFNDEIFAFDLSVAEGPQGRDLQGDDGLLTAVFVSLFTDRRANDDDPLPDERVGVPSDMRGWWGDYIDAEPDLIGSRLWLLWREKEMPVVVARAEEYAKESLAWLIRDGHVSQLRVTAHHISKGYLGIGVAALPPDHASDKPLEWLFTFDYANPTPVSISAPGIWD